MRPENHDFRKMHIKHPENTQEHSGLLYESPGGNQVDGLPPVAHTGAGSICRPRPSEHCPEIRVFDELVLEIPL